MAKMQCDKGVAAERELYRLLSERFGTNIIRNQKQNRSGGHDLAGVGSFALEVKRQEQLSINIWWRQTLDQAARAGKKPSLAYRQRRKPWRFIVRLQGVAANMTDNLTAELCLERWLLPIGAGG